MTVVRISRPSRGLTGGVHIPADKSISHRAILFAAMSEGESRLVGVLDSGDVRSTVGAVAALGARVVASEGGPRGLRVTVQGWGERGPVSPGVAIDCGNSGTTARLLTGVLAGWPIDVTLTGDVSLSLRPMRRVTEPLRLMGAIIETTEHGTLPVRIRGANLIALDYVSPVASAQVKSAVLLAGLRATGTTRVTEPALSRDHTERMLPAFGVPCAVDFAGRSAAVKGPITLTGSDIIVPGDPSSAAFIAVAATLVPHSHIRIRNVSLNPTRTGFIDVLKRMGAKVSTDELPPMGGEPVGTIVVDHAARLVSTHITADEVPSMIDEIPILALLATQAEGKTRFDGVYELQVKESNRLEAIRSGLTAFGARVSAGSDWLEIEGPTPLCGTKADSMGDHRLAMTWAVAGLIADGETTIEAFDAVGVSYPGFLEDIKGLSRER
jgi:3-phosphoshikimate 1-carboxyvinyltransferase